MAVSQDSSFRLLTKPQLIWVGAVALCLIGGVLLLIRDALIIDRSTSELTAKRLETISALFDLHDALMHASAAAETASWSTGVPEGLTTNVHQARERLTKLFQLLDEGAFSTTPAMRLDLDVINRRLSAAELTIMQLDAASGQQRTALIAQLRAEFANSDAIVDSLLLHQRQMESDLLTQIRSTAQQTRFFMALALLLLALLGSLLLLVHRRALRQERRANQRFALAASAVNGAIYEWDPHKQRMIWSDGLSDVFGYQPGQVEQTLEWWLDHIHPEDRERVETQLRHSIANGQEFAAEYRFYNSNGNYRDVLDRGCVVRPARGHAGYMVGCMMDITARKQAQEALADEKERLAVTLSSISEGVIATDTQRRIMLINKVAEQLTGWSHEEALGRPLAQIFQVVSARAALNSSDPNLDGYSVLLARDGSKRIVADSAAPILDHAQNIIGVVLVFTDVTERRLLEQQLHQAQKMESIGALAGGIAHDFNNILTGIIGYIDLALMELEPEHQIIPDLQEIKRQSEHAAVLTRQLLAFSRRQTINPNMLDLNEAILSIERFLRRVIGKHIELEIALTPKQSMVLADQVQIEQVLMNLSSNARDAMPDGGTLSISTSVADLSPTFCRTHLWARPGRYVKLIVADTGAGIDEETLQHIFEPFFTTKEVGKGTGLGLATVYGIVQQHSGLLNVTSARDVGTQFHIYLPMAESEVDEPTNEEQQHVQRGTETLLIAEDEQPVREILQRILTELGYRVLAAADGQEALEIFQRADAPIDMVILDLVMPKLTGKAVYERLIQQRSDLRFLFISGYNVYENPEHFVVQERHPFLHKPFTSHDLGVAVRRVLDHTTAPAQV